jgi:hypothetical protein
MAGRELIGDSARGDEYAAVRLVVEGDEIVEADAPGLDRCHEGLTLLEAAAVPGGTLAADALANAIAPAFSAAPTATCFGIAATGAIMAPATRLKRGTRSRSPASRRPSSSATSIAS